MCVRLPVQTRFSAGSGPGFQSVVVSQKGLFGSAGPEGFPGCCCLWAWLLVVGGTLVSARALADVTFPLLCVCVRVASSVIYQSVERQCVCDASSVIYHSVERQCVCVRARACCVKRYVP